MHENTGQKALAEAGLWEQFQRFARYDAEDLIITDRHNKVYYESRGESRGRPKIDRSVLQDIMRESLPQDAIRWNCHLRKVDSNGTLHFDHGVENGFDLVVGADGAWSKVRQVLSTIPPFYAGISGFEFWIPNLEATNPDLDRLMGNGSYYAYGDEERKVLMVQRQGNRSLRVYAYMVQPESWAKEKGANTSDSAAVRNYLLQEYEDCYDGIYSRQLYSLPVGLRWPHTAGVTVIGDAAHVMSPFAGEGVNTALHDSLELASCIVASKGKLDDAVRVYERRMFRRAEIVQKVSWEESLHTFDVGGAIHLADRVGFLTEMQRKGIPVVDNGLGSDRTADLEVDAEMEFVRNIS
jgi:2-polyprenyl-6-methoxyphenol hydroxylase-like FAD-dependent oxidoreductase